MPLFPFSKLYIFCYLQVKMEHLKCKDQVQDNEYWKRYHTAVQDNRLKHSRFWIYAITLLLFRSKIALANERHNFDWSKQRDSCSDYTGLFDCKIGAKYKHQHDCWQYHKRKIQQKSDTKYQVALIFGLSSTFSLLRFSWIRKILSLICSRCRVGKVIIFRLYLDT